FQAEDGIRDGHVTGVQTCALPIFAYKGKQVNPQQAGRDLKVRAVLTGSVAQHGGLLIIRAELVDVADASQLWGEQYQKKLDDIQIGRASCRERVEMSEIGAEEKEE